MGQYARHVFVCTTGKDCPTRGDAEGMLKYLRGEAAKAGLKDDVRVNNAGCLNQCGHGPMMVVYPENVWYAGVKDADLPELFESHIRSGRPVQRLVYDPGVKGANKTPDHL
ncbi:MAG: (2Fe-2S) ferredoxin domain-containing protein [Candidatus Rokubacteria bacterium]|nr:(2Fe-2S) ferredoxin domain-containing protein [Candidatus Rokubacteria bacterium]